MRYDPCILLCCVLLASVVSAAPPHYDRWETFDTATGLPSEKVFTVYAGASDIWAGTDRGLARYRQERWTVYTTKDGLAHNAVLGVSEDPDTGDVWIATLGGLNRYSAGRFETFNQFNSGLVNDVVYGVTMHRGSDWAATAAGASRYDIARKRWDLYDHTTTPMHEPWCCSVTGAGDKVYLAVWGGGLLEYTTARNRWKDYRDPDGEMEIDLFRNDGLVHDVVASVTRDAAERIWIGTYFGLSSYDGRKWRNFMDHDSPLVSNFINVVHAQGHFAWIGTDNGLNACDRDDWWTYQRDAKTGTGWVTWTPAQGPAERFRTTTIFPHNYILGIAFQGSAIWVATEKGLARGILTTPHQASVTEHDWGPDTHASPVASSAGAQPVGVSAERPATNRPTNYGRTPTTAIPYRGFREPYVRFFDNIAPFRGAGRARAPAGRPASARIGVLVPAGSAPDADLGRQMLEGITLAVDRANAEGGYDGTPFVLTKRNDLGLWGGSSNEMAAFRYDDDVLAVIGAIDGASTHIALRAALKLAMPMVNTATTDPTLTETNIPWRVRCMADDRQQGYALAHHIFRECGLTRVVALRVNDRFGRTGIAEFRDAARRLQRPLHLELRWKRGDRNFSRQLDRVAQSAAQAIVIWSNADDAAALVKAVRRRKLPVRIFGCDRLVSRRFLVKAGPAAERVTAVASHDPTRDDARWASFAEAYRKRFDHEPETFAAHAFDGTNVLIAAIRQAGLNRIRIRDALFALPDYDGVTGPIKFDTTRNDIGPVYIATVTQGEYVYRPAEFAAADHTYVGSTPYRTLAESPPAARTPLRALADQEQALSIGCFLPLDDVGQSVVRGARLAIEEDAARHAGRTSARLLVREARGQWGDDTRQLVDLVSRERVSALITSTDARTTHLAEMLAAKLHFPVLTLCDSDPTITQIPLAWVFCLGPAAEIDAFFANRYEDRYGMLPDIAAALGYDAVAVVIAQASAGRRSHRGLRDGLATGQWTDGATGRFRFDPLGNRVNRCAEPSESRRADRRAPAACDLGAGQDNSRPRPLARSSHPRTLHTAGRTLRRPVEPAPMRP